MTETNILIEVKGLRKSFGPLNVMDGLDFTLFRGENVAILGQSGSGKSVLLKVIIGLLEPDEGEVSLWGLRISDLDNGELNALRRKMGMVFQSGALFDSMTVFENLVFPLVEHGFTDEEKLRAVVKERLEWVDLSGAEDKYPSELSGGMRKRVALARTLAADPELILYDEPPTGLDPITSQKISSMIQEIDNRVKSTSIVVTHDLDCARKVAGRWCYLSGGEILADGTPEELFEGPHEEVRNFLRGVSVEVETKVRDVEDVPGEPTSRGAE